MGRSDRILALATRHVPTVLTIAAALVAVIGYVDLETGPGLRIFPLYFIPISLAAWSARRPGAVFFALLCAVVWGVSNWAWHSSDAYFAANVSTQAIAFGSIAALTSSMRRNFDMAVHTSMVDALTGLANTRGFYDRTEHALQLAARRQSPLTLVYLDLDDFKKVNDEHGHHEGDKVLQAVAASIRSSTRGTDIAARLGGDEFALVLVDADRAAAEATIGRIRSSFLEAMRKHAWPVRASVGALVVREVPADARLVKLMREVDALMYEAKEQGKDTVVVRERAVRTLGH